MDLDHRAADAAARLRHDVESDLDLDAALDRVASDVGRHRTRLALVRSAGLAFVVLGLLGGLAVLQAGGRAGPPDPTGEVEESADGVDRDDTVEAIIADDGLTSRGAAILGGLPDGPLDGRESWRLPVVADPRDGVADGDMVTLYGRGFEPGELVGAVHCASEADTSAMGVGACDLGESFSNTTTTSARSDGSVVVQVVIRRHITTPELGAVDCASAPERCLLAIGAADNYDRSGGSYVNFADAPPFPEPTLTVDPPGPYPPGQEVTVVAGGSIAGRPAQVLQCAGEEHCVPLSQGRVAADGTYAATVTIGSAVELDGQTVTCEDAGGCTLVYTGIGVPDATSQPFPPPYPIELLPGEATVGPVEASSGPAPAGPGSVQPPSTEAPTASTEPAPSTAEVVPSTELPATTDPAATAPPPTAGASSGGG